MADLMREGHALNVPADGAYNIPPTAGRELDALVAEKVMGWANVGMKQMHSLTGGNFGQPTTLVPDGEALRGNPPNAPEYAREQHVPFFSTDIAAAWLVMEKVREQGWRVVIEVNAHGEYEALMDTRRIFRTAEADSAPLAICRASLQAVEAINAKV